MAIGVGVAIDPDALRGVVLERSGTRLKLIVAQEFPCETANPDALTSALAQLRKALRITTPVVLGLPSTSAILTTLHALIVNPRRAELAVEFELQQHLPFALSDAIWHHHWLSLVNGDGVATPRFSSAGASYSRTSSAVVAAVRQTLLQERLACCRRAGLPVSAVTVDAVAALTVWEKSRAGVPLRAQGAAGKGGVRAIDATTRGARAGASKTVTLLRLNGERAAEWIRRTPETLEVIPMTATSPETWWQELAASWEAISGAETGALAPVIVAGQATALSRLQQAGLSATQLDLGQLVEGPSGLMEQLDGGVAALGLALHGVGEVLLPLNLLAVSQEEGRVQRTQRAATVITSLCVLATMGFGASGMMQMRRQRLLVLQELERREHLYLTLRPEVRSTIQRQQHTDRRNAQLQQLLVNGTMLSRLLAQLTDAMPNGIWLTLLDCAKSAAGPAAQANSAELMTGTLEGRSSSFQDVTQFMDRLKSVAAMSAVKPLSTNVITDETSGKEAIGFAVQVQRSLEPPTVAAATAATESVPPDKAGPSTGKPASTSSAASTSAKKKPKRTGTAKR